MKRLPKGEQYNPGFCVLARATGTTVDGLHANIGDNEFRLTKRLENFVERFDDGKYPWLIAS